MAYETRLNASITTIVSVTHRTWDRWTVELRVPLAELMIVPKPGEVLRMNIIHNVPVGNGGEVSTWYPEPLRGPHWDLANLGWAILE